MNDIKIKDATVDSLVEKTLAEIVTENIRCCDSV